jgi:hypothetical protein
MRSSYTTFFQFYIGLLIVSVFIFHGLYFSLITVMFLVRVLLATILLLVIFRIKFLKIERDKIKVTNVLGRSIYIGNKEIQGFGRLYFQICWISLGNGKKIFFMQRMLDTFHDLFTKEESRLEKFYGAIISTDPVW